MSAQHPAPLETHFQPSRVTVELAADPEIIDQAQDELALRARQDPYGCFGYFPALAGLAGIVSDLPASQRFAAAAPDIEADGMTMSFNFLRFSNRNQGSQHFHIDTDAATGLTGTLQGLNSRLVKRTLLNLSTQLERTVSYIDVDPDDVTLQALDSYLRLSSTEAYTDRQVHIVLPPREGAVVYGFDFYSNRVLHAGIDNEQGHFVAGYGTEIALDPWGSGV